MLCSESMDNIILKDRSSISILDQEHMGQGQN